MNRKALSISVWDETGHKAIELKNDGDERCTLCESLLSVYNEGPYCFAHEKVGLAIDDELEELRIRRNQTKYKGKTTRYTKEYNKKYYERIRKARQN